MIKAGGRTIRSEIHKLTENYKSVRLGKNLSHMFPIRNDLEQGDSLSPLILNFALEYAIRSGRQIRMV